MKYQGSMEWSAQDRSNNFKWKQKDKIEVTNESWSFPRWSEKIVSYLITLEFYLLLYIILNDCFVCLVLTPKDIIHIETCKVAALVKSCHSLTMFFSHFSILTHSAVSKNMNGLTSFGFCNIGSKNKNKISFFIFNVFNIHVDEKIC